MPPTEQATGKGSLYSPPKDWDELTAEGKIERMREVIKNLSRSNEYMNNAIYKLRRQLSQHEHADGKVIEQKQITQYDDDAPCGISVETNNNYF